MVCLLVEKRALQVEARWSRTLHRSHPAPQRHRYSAHGAHVEQHDTRHSRTPGPHGGQERLLGTRHRPRLDCHRSQSGEQTRRPGYQEERPHPRGVPQICLGVERGARRHHPQAAAEAGCLVRLGPHRLHHGRGSLQERAEGICRPLQQGAHLPRRAHGQLGPQGTHRPLRRRGYL